MPLAVVGKQALEGALVILMSSFEEWLQDSLGRKPKTASNYAHALSSTLTRMASEHMIHSGDLLDIKSQTEFFSLNKRYGATNLDSGSPIRTFGRTACQQAAARVKPFSNSNDRTKYVFTRYDVD